MVLFYSLQMLSLMANALPAEKKAQGGWGVLVYVKVLVVSASSKLLLHLNIQTKVGKASLVPSLGGASCRMDMARA